MKLFKTSSSLSFAKLSKLSSKHRATQSKQNLNWFSSKANTVAVYSLQKQTKQRNTRSALPNSIIKEDLHLLDLTFTPLLVDRTKKLSSRLVSFKIQTILRYGLLGSRQLTCCWCCYTHQTFMFFHRETSSLKMNKLNVIIWVWLFACSHHATT